MTPVKFTQSLESLTGDLHMWDINPTQVGIKESRVINYYPLSSITNTETITFSIPGQPKLFLDFVEIVAKIKIENAPEKSQVAVNTNLAASLWKNVSVSVGGTTITQSFDYAYAISQFFDLAINTSPDRADSLLYSQGFLIDDAINKEKSESLAIYEIQAVDATGDSPKVDHQAPGNPAAAQRIERFSLDGDNKTRVGTLISPLASSLFSQSKLLIDNLTIQVALTKKEHGFCLQAPNNTDAKLTITDVYLKVHYKIPVDEVIEGIEMRLKREPSRYDAERKEVTMHQLPFGVTTHTFRNLFQGVLPMFFVAGVNNRSAYSGQSHRNPWTFFNLESIQCHVNGEPFYPKPVEGPEELFNAFQEALGHKIKGSCLLTPKNFNTHNLICLPLTADRSVRHHKNLMTHGVVDLTVTPQARTGTDYCLVVYAIYNRLIEIDSYRQIRVL